MRPDLYDSEKLHPAYEEPLRKSGLTGPTQAARDATLMAEIVTHFLAMRDGGIPIHVLIGRRHTDGSSLYRGWPYNKASWARELSTPFDAGLGSIAPLIDSLSIMYDLRNPIDSDRLDDINALDGYKWPDKPCPRIVCPWIHLTNCVFATQWRDKRSPTAPHIAIPWARKNPHLAPSIAPFPPAGEYADANPSDSDEDTDSLHHRALHAAYAREAVFWHRFWNTYTSKLINLSLLNVRMPRGLDQVRSRKLAQLLDGWRYKAFADERQHVQTRLDHVGRIRADGSEFSHRPQESIWPAGRFARRTWVSRCSFVWRERADFV